MLISHIVTSLVVLLILALISEPLSRLVRLPFTSVLVIAGFVGSEIIVAFGVDTGLRADNFHDLIFYVFIPVLVFEAAYRIDKQLLFSNLVPVLFLAIIGMFLTTALTAAGIYYGIAHPTGFPWIAALLTGAILAATDPVAVVARLREIHAPKRLGILLEGESLFNDATAIVLYGLFISIAVSMQAEATPAGVVVEFLKVFVGGAVCGLVIGFAAGFLNRINTNVVMTGLLTIAVAYGSYLVAEGLLHVSGVTSTLVAAIAMSSIVNNDSTEEEKVRNDHLWDVTGNIANAIVFILMGVTITVSMFEERWLAMLIAIAAVVVARAVSTYGSLTLLGKIQKEPVDMRYPTVMVWGGLRGAIALALALSLPVTLDYWWTIQSIAFGVVLFTLFVQAPTVRLLVKKLGIHG